MQVAMMMLILCPCPVLTTMVTNAVCDSTQFAVFDVNWMSMLTNFDGIGTRWDCRYRSADDHCLQGLSHLPGTVETF